MQFCVPFALSRVILDVTLWTIRSVVMAPRDLSLGRFGDRRLDKRGRRCSGAWHDRRLVNGEGLYAAAERFALTTARLVALPTREGKRQARLATLTLRFGKVELARPANTRDRNLPRSVALTLVEVVERDPPTGTQTLHSRLLTTHHVAHPAPPRHLLPSS